MESTGKGKMAVLVSGTVTSFNAAKGYGFVAQGGGGELFAQENDIYRHRPHILALGQRVLFEVVQDAAGPHVIAVRKN